MLHFSDICLGPAMATSSNTPLPQDDDLWMFLQSRGIPEENIQKMQQDHVGDSILIPAIYYFILFYMLLKLIRLYN